MKRLFIFVLIFTLFGFAYGDDLTEYEKDLIQGVKGLFGEDVSRAKITTEPFPLPICGTPLLGELEYKFESLSPEAKKILKPYLSRPSLPDTFGTSYFKIHYTTVGDSAVYQSGVDVDPVDGIPDYVNRCAEILDSVKAFEIDSLGYQAPPSDGDSGGDSRYDIYLLKLDEYYGWCAPESYSPYPKATSYIVLRSDYSQFAGWYSDSLDPVRVTSAHEFFHAIQFGYDETERVLPSGYNPYWFEISSVWMEDVAYDNINDYLSYLRYFFGRPYLSLETFSSNPSDPYRYYHCYASCIWAMYLTEKYGIDIMKDIWTACAKKDSSNVIPATDSILSLKGSSYDDAFREFTVWNFFTNTRAITSQFYSEGNLFNANSKINPVPGQFHDFSSLDTFYKSSVSYPPEHLGSNYVFLYPKATQGGMRLHFYGNSSANWRVSIIGYKAGQSVYINEMTLDPDQNGTFEVKDAHLDSVVVMVPAVINKSGGPWNFSCAAKWDPLLEVEEDEKKEEIEGFCLSQNYPNPFNSVTSIQYTVNSIQNQPIHTTFTIYNILGQKVKTLVDQKKNPGNHTAFWDGKDDSGFEVSSGVYFYKLKAGDFEEVKRLVFLK